MKKKKISKRELERRNKQSVKKRIKINLHKSKTPEELLEVYSKL